MLTPLRLTDYHQFISTNLMCFQNTELDCVEVFEVLAFLQSSHLLRDERHSKNECEHLPQLHKGDIARKDRKESALIRDRNEANYPKIPMGRRGVTS